MSSSGRQSAHMMMSHISFDFVYILRERVTSVHLSSQTFAYILLARRFIIVSKLTVLTQTLKSDTMTHDCFKCIIFWRRGVGCVVCLF